MQSEWQSFLQDQGATISENESIIFEHTDLDISNTPLVSTLSGFVLLAVEGNDRHSFLHGQFVNDLNLIEKPSAQFSAWCNPKGQVITNFLIINTGISYLLLFKKDLGEYVQKRLKMFVLRSDVIIKDISDNTPIIGIANNPDLSNIGLDVSTTPGDVTARDGRVIVNLPDASGRQLILSNIETQTKTLTALKKYSMLTGSKTWELLDILSGLPWITSKTQEEFLPQMLNLDLLNGLSYKKGCYPGQEVIARLHFRGNVKKRIQLMKSGNAIKIGDVISSIDTNIGMIVNVAQHPDKYYLGLAVISLESVDKELLINQNPINILQLHYVTNTK